MKKELVLKKVKLYISDNFLLDMDKASESEKEQYRKDGFTDDDFGRVHMVEFGEGHIFNPMCADIVFREQIHEMMEEEVYDYSVKEIKIGKVNRIDDKNYSLAAIAFTDEGNIVREFLIQLD